MDLKTLRERFPLMAARFAESPYADGKPEQLQADLVSFLRTLDHHIFTSHTPPGSKRSKKPIYYSAIIQVKGTTLEGLTHDHLSYDEAVEEAVVIVLNMWEQHMMRQMRSRSETTPLKQLTDEALLAELFRRFMPLEDTQMRNTPVVGALVRATTSTIEVTRDVNKMVIERSS